MCGHIYTIHAHREASFPLHIKKGKNWSLTTQKWITRCPKEYVQKY
jgi:hypothetical protein